MDCTEIKVEMAEEELLEPLVITEDGDRTEGDPGRGAASGPDAAAAAAAVKHCGEESVLRKEEDHNREDTAGTMYLEEQRPEEDHAQEEGKPEGTDGQSRHDTETHEATTSKEKPETSSSTENDPGVDVKRSNLSEQQPEGELSQEEDPEKARRLTPDFPEALYELLCTLQEGRRLNDQRCSFRLEGGIRRRRCHSEPNTTKPANRVVFSSMTSLQKEEFFELVATAQARRLDDQRALLERSPPPKPKTRSFRGSIKQLSFVRKPAPVPVPKEDLYNMILTTQAQGRLEDQRSRAPGPMDDEDFFSLLLRVQGGRMDEQRTELPCMLQT